MKNIAAMLIEPGKEPELICIEPTGKRIRELVGGPAEFTWPIGDGICVAVSETGKLDGLPLNRSVRDSDGKILDIYAGNMLLRGDHSDDEFDSLTAEDVILAAECFGRPETWDAEKIFSEFGCESDSSCP